MNPIALRNLANELAIEALLDLIDDLTDPDDCRLDHDGGCQVHAWFAGDEARSCPHARAQKLLAARSGPDCVTAEAV